MVKATEVGMEVFPGFTIKWQWIDGILCGIIEKGEAGINDLAEQGVNKLDDSLQTLVDNNELKFDNVGKDTLSKAFTLAMVKRHMPELLPNP